MRLKHLLLASSFALAAFLSAGAAQASTVTLNFGTSPGNNGSTSNFPGVTFSGFSGVENPAFQGTYDSSSNLTYTSADAGASGDYVSLLVTNGNNEGKISINLSALDVSVGQTVGLSFYLGEGYSWGGSPVVVKEGAAVLGTYTPGTKGWIKETLSFVATADPLTIAVTGFNSANDLIDAISITAAVAGQGGIGSTPELSTSLMLSLSGLGLGFMAWRRRDIAA
jgi:hypothetical protein